MKTKHIYIACTNRSIWNVENWKRTNVRISKEKWSGCHKCIYRNILISASNNLVDGSND